MLSNSRREIGCCEPAWRSRMLSMTTLQAVVRQGHTPARNRLDQLTDRFAVVQQVLWTATGIVDGRL